MGYDLIAVIAFVILAPLTVLGFIIFWMMTHRTRGKVEDQWRDYAEKRGLAFEEATGEWPNRTSPAIAWSEGDATFRMVIMGRESKAHTRIVAKPASTLLGDCVIVVRDPASIDERGTATRLLDDSLRRALMVFEEPISLAYRKGKLTIEWRGREVESRRLDEARAIAKEATAAVDRAFHRVAPPSSPARASNA